GGKVRSDLDGAARVEIAAQALLAVEARAAGRAVGAVAGARRALLADAGAEYRGKTGRLFADQHLTDDGHEAALGDAVGSARDDVVARIEEAARVGGETARERIPRIGFALGVRIRLTEAVLVDRAAAGARARSRAAGPRHARRRARARRADQGRVD